MASSAKHSPKSSTSSFGLSRTRTRKATKSSINSKASSQSKTATVASHHSGSSSNDETENPNELWFASFNSLAPVTVVLLHMLFSSHLEWAHVWTKITEYHLLIPDLPQHSRSRHLKPFSFAYAADLVANMIRAHAQDGKAHIVGLSMGGYVAMELIRRHPDLVQSATVSGSSPPRNKILLMLQHPMVMYTGLWGMLHSPGGVFLKASGFHANLANEQILKDIKKNMTQSLCERANREMASFQGGHVFNVGKADVRILVVACGKQDPVDNLSEMAGMFRSLGKREGKESCCYVVKDAVHAWNLQIPDVFARGIKAWVERRPLPLEFELLE